MPASIWSPVSDDATDLKYTFPNSKAVEVNLALILSQVINVKYFGAQGDGTTDDTTAIQNAINAATGAITGYKIYFPPGIYKISQTLAVGEKQNIYLVGDGPNVTVISPTSLVAKAISFGAGGGTAYQGIFNLHINCASALACIGIETQFCDSFWLDRVVVSNADIGLSIVGGVSQFYTNFRINLSKTAGIKLNGGNDHFFSEGLLSNAGSAEPTTGGIWVVKSDAFWLDAVDCIAQKHSLILAPQGTDYISWVFISRFAGDSGAGNGIHVEPAVSALVKGVHIADSWTASNEEYGVYLGGLGTIDGFRMNGHRSFRNKKSGYYAATTGTVTNFAFNACDASGNSWTNANVYSGFDIGAGVSGFSIIGCRSGQMADQLDTQSRGILVNAGTSDNYIIALNDLRDNLSAGLLDAGTGLNKQVSLNIS